MTGLRGRLSPSPNSDSVSPRSPPHTCWGAETQGPRKGLGAKHFGITELDAGVSELLKSERMERCGAGPSRKGLTPHQLSLFSGSIMSDSCEPRTVACQGPGSLAPRSKGFPRQERWMERKGLVAQSFL